MGKHGFLKDVFKDNPHKWPMRQATVKSGKPCFSLPFENSSIFYLNLIQLQIFIIALLLSKTAVKLVHLDTTSVVNNSTNILFLQINSIHFSGTSETFYFVFLQRFRFWSIYKRNFTLTSVWLLMIRVSVCWQVFPCSSLPSDAVISTLFHSFYQILLWKCLWIYGLLKLFASVLYNSCFL